MENEMNSVKLSENIYLNFPTSSTSIKRRVKTSKTTFNSDMVRTTANLMIFTDQQQNEVNDKKGKTLSKKVLDDIDRNEAKLYDKRSFFELYYICLKNSALIPWYICKEIPI